MSIGIYRIYISTAKTKLLWCPCQTKKTNQIRTCKENPTRHSSSYQSATENKSNNNTTNTNKWEKGRMFSLWTWNGRLLVEDFTFVSKHLNLLLSSWRNLLCFYSSCIEGGNPTVYCSTKDNVSIMSQQPVDFLLSFCEELAHSLT